MSNTLLHQYGPWALIRGGSEGISLCLRDIWRLSVPQLPDAGAP